MSGDLVEACRRIKLEAVEAKRLYAEHGAARFAEVIRATVRKAAAGKLKSPLGFLHAALKRQYKFDTAHQGRSSGYKPEAPQAKEAREAKDSERWRAEAEIRRPLMLELGQSRIADLKAAVLAEITDPRLREAFEPADPMACDCADAVRLAGLIWERHRTLLKTSHAPLEMQKDRANGNRNARPPGDIGDIVPDSSCCSTSHDLLGRR